MADPVSALRSSSSLGEVALGLDEIRNLDLRMASIDDLKRRLSRLLDGYGHGVFSINPNQFVYRARKLGPHSRPRHVSELSYPAPALVRRDQRVNRAGTSVFYCCAIPECTFYEIGAEVGDYVVLSMWHFAEPPRLNHVGFTDRVFRALGSRRAALNFNEKFAQIVHPIINHDLNALVGRFLSDAFTVVVEEGKNEHQYKLSIAISEIHLSGEVDGLWYPTIAMHADADNLALRPAYVDRHVRFISADLLLISGHDASGPRFRLADRCSSADQDGRLIWSGFSDAWYYEGFSTNTNSGRRIFPPTPR